MQRPLHIAFFDPAPWQYSVETVYREPLGGSQSAAIYLAEALSRMGHQVHFVSKTQNQGTFHGVDCVDRSIMNVDLLQQWKLDAMIVVLGAGLGRHLRAMISPRCKLILWTQHAADQAGVGALAEPAERNVYDAIVLVSKWQQEQLSRAFSLNPSRVVVMQNAIAPAFEGLFAPDESILAAKTERPLLAYTSTPHRGLELLLHLFPTIRHRLPQALLLVYSSLRVYQIPPDQDEFNKLYDACRNTPGVEYVGSIPQSRLAPALRQVSILAYPNIYPETSCISVMEAMAAGCVVVTSELAAIPETAAGFGRLISSQIDARAYCQDFIKAIVSAAHELFGSIATVEQFLRRQVEFANRSYVWGTRAQQWTEWLGDICGRTPLVR
jgi:glycosyltransferase involved in cell wall biosynthesis